MLIILRERYITSSQCRLVGMATLFTGGFLPVPLVFMITLPEAGSMGFRELVPLGVFTPYFHPGNTGVFLWKLTIIIVSGKPLAYFICPSLPASGGICLLEVVVKIFVIDIPRVVAKSYISAEICEDIEIQPFEKFSGFVCQVILQDFIGVKIIVQYNATSCRYDGYS